jgi:predicted DNA binding CopG/RHH family protein
MDDKKDNNIRVRVNDTLMTYITDKSRQEGINVSEHIRRMITREMTEEQQTHADKDSIWD